MKLRKGMVVAVAWRDIVCGTDTKHTTQCRSYGIVHGISKGTLVLCSLRHDAKTYRHLEERTAIPCGCIKHVDVMKKCGKAHVTTGKEKQ